MLANRNGVGSRFLRGYLAGLRQYNEGKVPRNLDIAARATRLPTELLMAACWPSMASDGRVSLDGLQAYQECLLERRVIDQIVPARDLFVELRTAP